MSESSFWKKIISAEEIPSTNDECKRLAREGADHGTVLIARRQSAGRGRLGREWDSPSGGLYLSALLRPAGRLAPEDLPAFPLAVAMAVVRACEGLGATGVGVKWPNDVRTARGKLAGVLMESSVEGGMVAWVVVGIGLNVSRPACPVSGADYLTDAEEPAQIEQAAFAVLDELAAAYDKYCVEGFGGVRDEYEERSVLTGHDVTVRDGKGVVIAAGPARGVDEQGRLRVLTGAGIESIVAGDVTLGGS